MFINVSHTVLRALCSLILTPKFRNKYYYTRGARGPEKLSSISKATQLVRIRFIWNLTTNLLLLKCCLATLGQRVGSMKRQREGWAWKERKGRGKGERGSMQRQSDLLQSAEGRGGD